MRKASKVPRSVEEFLATFDHPLEQEVLTLRQIILAADPSITEGIKWNAPSFRTSEYFATFHLRAMDYVQVILHRGAKPRDPSEDGFSVADPHSLLTWLDRDRASVKFRNIEEIEAKRSALTDVIRQWIKHI